MHIVNGKQTALLKDLNNLLYGKENFLLEKVRSNTNYSALGAHYQRKSTLKPPHLSKLQGSSWQ